jgi:hypothetical protein
MRATAVIVAGCVVAALAGGTYWYLSSGGGSGRPSAGASSTQIASEIFFLKELTAQDGCKAVETILTPGLGKAETIDNMNGVLVRDVPAKLQEAKQLFAQIDVKAKDSGTTVTPQSDSAQAARKCQENLAKLDGAKEQWALEFKKPMGTVATMRDLITPGGAQPGQGYLKREPVCPSGGTYTFNAVGTNPTCSLGAAQGHVLP